MVEYCSVAGVAVALRRMTLNNETIGHLRIIRNGDDCEINKIRLCQCFCFLGATYRLYMFSSEEFMAWDIADHSEHLFDPNTIITPVWLERVS